MLRVERVGMVFPNGRTALDSISFAVRRGEFLSLLGPSGCGKSTVLRIVAGLLAPSKGRIAWQDGAPLRQQIGFVFQEPTLMPWASAFDNVYMPLKLRGQSRSAARPRILEALAQVGLPDVAEAYPRELSGGMKMRVSIARALVTEPKLLLMDEPFAALDEMTRFKLNQDLLSLRADRDLTILFVTHSVYESVFLSSRVTVMAARPGRILHDIPIDLSYPREPALRMSPAYNDLCGHVSQTLQGAMNPQDFM